jgi:hypothetical protein
MRAMVTQWRVEVKCGQAVSVFSLFPLPGILRWFVAEGSGAHLAASPRAIYLPDSEPLKIVRIAGLNRAPIY